jgi:hypothetical protein
MQPREEFRVPYWKVQRLVHRARAQQGMDRAVPRQVFTPAGDSAIVPVLSGYRTLYSSHTKVIITSQKDLGGKERDHTGCVSRSITVRPHGSVLIQDKYRLLAAALSKCFANTFLGGRIEGSSPRNHPTAPAPPDPTPPFHGRGAEC